MTRRLLAALIVTATVFTLVARAQPGKDLPIQPIKPVGDAAARAGKTEVDPKVFEADAPNQQDRLKRQYEEFKLQLLRLAQRLENSPRPEDKEKAQVLKDALAKASDLQLESKFNKLISDLKSPGTYADTDVIASTITTNDELRKDLNFLIEMLQRDNKDAERKRKIEETARLLEMVRDLITKEERIRARTDLKQPADQIKPDQDKANKKMDELAHPGQKKVDYTKAEGKLPPKSESKEGKPGQPKDDAKDPKGEERSLEGKPNESKEGKPTENKESKPGESKETKEGKPGDSKEGKPSDNKENKPSDAKDGKGGDKPEGKPSDPKDGKGGENKESKPADSKTGESKDGKPGEGKPGESKESKPGDSKGGESKEGKPSDPKDGKGGENKESKPGESKANDSKEGKPGEGKPADSKSGEPKAGKPGDPKEGKPGEGKPGEPKPGEPKPGEGKAGEGKPGDPKPGDGKPSEGKPGEGKPSDSKAKGDGKGEAKPGSGKPGEGKPGEGKPSGGKPGEGKPGEGKPGDGGGSPPPPGKAPPPPPPSDLDPARKKIGEAEQAGRKASNELEKNKPDAAAPKIDEAAEKLEQARKQLEELLRTLREQEAERILAQLQSRCEKMLAVETAIRDGTLGLDKAINAHDDHKPDRVDVQAGNGLADKQDGNVKEANAAIRIIEAEGSAVAFAEVFKQVREDMITTKSRLDRTDSGVVTVQIENDIIATLGEMIEALKKARKEVGKPKPPPPPGQPGKPPKPGLIDEIAELKMIRSMQEKVNKRTTLYGRQYPGQQLPNPVSITDQKLREQIESIQKELQDLSKRQETIHRVTDDIAKGKNKNVD